ncbi:Unconventional myosin-XVI [Phytophthora ramorum]|nr:Myosin-2 heavy chain [Phytophthora ramorum]
MGMTTSLHPTESGDTIVVEKVLKSNPLLEAFEGAKTTGNDSSSRFGKITQLQFNSELCLVDADGQVAQTEGESNYHIIYRLVSAKEDSDTDFKSFWMPRRFLNSQATCDA